MGRVKIRDIVRSIEKWAPITFAEEWDNPGLLTGNPDQETDSVLISLNATEDALKNAKEKNAQLLITHHPLIFKPLKNITESKKHKDIIYAVRNNIAVYSSHTNLDTVKDGVSFALAEKIGLTSISFLCNSDFRYVKFVTYAPEKFAEKIISAASESGAGKIGKYSNCSFTAIGTGTYTPLDGAKPLKGKKGILSKEPEIKIEMIVSENLINDVINSVRMIHPYEEMAYDILTLQNKCDYSGYGAIGILPKPMTLNDFLCHVSNVLQIETLKYSICEKREIKKVAVMGGAGGRYVKNAVDKGADAYITGEAGYHEFIDHGESIVFIEVSHQSTEIPVLEKIKDYLIKEFGKSLSVNIHNSKNIMNYYHLK